MRERYISAIIMLTAGTIVSVINIINKIPLVTGLKRLLLVLVLFYFIGLIAQAIISKVIATNRAANENETDETDTDEVDQSETID